MKVSKECGSNLKNCIKLGSAFGDATDAVILADGITVGLPSKGITTSGYNFIAVDIDGINKGRSNGGEDLFYFELDTANRTIFPSGQNDSDGGLLACQIEMNHKCAYWVIRNENMDYLKCPD